MQRNRGLANTVHQIPLFTAGTDWVYFFVLEDIRDQGYSSVMYLHLKG